MVDFPTIEPSDTEPTAPTVSLAPVDASEQPTVSLDTTAFGPPLPQTVVANRAYKAYAGLKNYVQQDYTSMADQIGSGQEPKLRDTATSAVNEQIVKDTVTKVKDASINPNFQAADVQNIVNSVSPATPGTVIERMFAQTHMEGLDEAKATWGPTLFDDAQQTLPQTTNLIKNRGSEVATQNELINTYKQNAGAKISTQSWPTYLKNTGLPMIPVIGSIYTEAQLRGNVPGSDGGLFLGTNMASQARAMRNLPMDQFTQRLDTLSNTLTPQVFMEFLDSLQGMSSSQIVMHNISSTFDVATTIGGGFAGKAFKFAKGADFIVDSKGVASINPTGRFAIEQKIKETARAVGDMAESIAPVSDPVSATIAKAEGAGNYEEAAVQKFAAAIDAVNRGEYDSTKAAADSMISMVNASVDAAKQAPGHGGQEIINRFEQGGRQTEDLVNGMIDSMHVDPNPELQPGRPGVAQLVRDMNDEYKDNFTGTHSRILDIVGPIHEKLSNTRWRQTLLGNFDGTLFKSRADAAAAAAGDNFVVRGDTATLRDIDERLGVLNEDVKAGPSEDADVHELNRYDRVSQEKDRLDKLRAEIVTNTHGVTIEQQGAGFYISHMSPFSTKTPVYKAFIEKDPSNVIPKSRFGTWFDKTVGQLRTPEDTLTAQENSQRHIAATAPNKLLGLLEDQSPAFQKLTSAKGWSEWKGVVDYARKAIDEDTGKRGYFFKNGEELDKHYQTVLQRLPSLDEKEAYFEYVRKYEIDRMFRILQSYSRKAQAGVEQHQISARTPEGMVKSGWIEGIKQNYFPGGDDTVMLMGDELGKEKFFKANQKFNRRGDVEQSVKNGESYVIRVYNPDELPFNGFGKADTSQRVRYVIVSARNYENKPMAFETQVAKRGGGHFVWDSDHYIKQANMMNEFIPGEKGNGEYRSIYLGDNTLMPMDIETKGARIVDHLNAVRELIKDGKWAEAEAESARRGLTIPWEEHKSWYTPKKIRNADGKLIDVPARLNPREPFYLVPKDKRIVDMDSSLQDRYKSTFKDGTREGSDARANQIEFTGARDADELFTLNDYGTKGNPIYKWEPSNMIDPVPTLNRALNRIVKSYYMDDMKRFSVDHWIAQAHQWLDFKGATLDDFRRAPDYYFEHALENWKKAAPESETAVLEDAWNKIKQFQGVPSDVDNFTHSAMQKLSDSIYSRGGAKAHLTATRFLPTLDNPIQFMKSVVFHTSMGLGSIPQFFTQLSTAANVMAISGPRSIPTALYAAYAHTLMSINRHPNIMAHLDRMATNFGFKPGEFLEGTRMMENAGFDVVGGEHAFKDNPWQTRIIGSSSIGSKILDWGQMPFELGATYTRKASYYVAYKEFRNANPLGEISRLDSQKILDRAAILDHNMTRAATARFQSGILSPMTQFQSYSVRLAELMWGKRLTPMEKLRLFGVSSVLYGVPLGGIGLFGVPAGDVIKDKATQYFNYVTGNNTAASTLMEGGLSALGAVISGNGDPRAGTWYNFSKYGVRGVESVGNFLEADSALDGDKHWWDVWGGPSATLVHNLWKNSTPFRYAVASMMSQDGAFKLTSEHFTAPLKNLSSYNAWDRFGSAVRTGNWLSKNGAILDTNVSFTDALFRTITGTTDQMSADQYSLNKVVKSRKDEQQQGLGLFLEEQRKAWVDNSNGDFDNMRIHAMNAKAYLVASGYPEERWGDAYRLSIQGNESVLAKTNWDAFMRNVAPEQKDSSMQTWKTIQEIQKLKGKN